ncbi:oligosaccharide flippase family protein [Priestia megaterium]
MVGQGIKQILYFMVGPFISRLFTFISLPVFSYYLTLEEFGLYNLFTMLLMYFVPLTTLGTEQYYLRNYSREGGYHNRTALFTMYVSLSIVYFVAFFIFLIFSGGKIISGIPSYYILIAIAVSILNSLQDIYIRTIRFYGLGEVYSRILFISQLFLFVLSISLVSIFENVFALLIAMLISAIFNLIINVTYFRKNIEKLEERNLAVTFNNIIKVIKEALKFSLPLLPSIFLWVLQSSVDRVFISKFLDNDALGLFSVGFKFASIVSLFVTSFLIFWEPKLYILYDKYGDSREFKKNVQKYKNFYSLFLNTILVVAFLLLPLGIKVMATDYRASLYIIPLMLFSNYIHGFSYFSGMGPQLRKITILSLFPLLISVVTNLILNLLLIKKLGLLGVILATNISFLVLLIINYLITKRLVKSVPNIIGELFKISLLIVVTIYFYVTHSYTLSSLGIIIIYVINLIENRKNLKEYKSLFLAIIMKKLKK